jgi:hypothetical protein
MTTIPPLVAGIYFADICSGVGGVAAELLRAGLPCKEFDIRHGTCGDITRPSVLRRLCQDAASGRLQGACFAPPCGTFSAALFWTGRLRSRDELWGLSTLGEKQRIKTSQANKVIHSVITIIKALNRHHIPWIIENPWQSLLWWVPFFIDMLATSYVQRIVCDFCRFGKPWRKRTVFISGHIDFQDLGRLNKQCTGTRGFCPANNGRRHFVLEGNDGHGIKWTKIAEAYPPSVSRAVAFALSSTFRNLVINAKLQGATFRF